MLLLQYASSMAACIMPKQQSRTLFNMLTLSSPEQNSNNGTKKKQQINNIDTKYKRQTVSNTYARNTVQALTVSLRETNYLIIMAFEK